MNVSKVENEKVERDLQDFIMKMEEVISPSNISTDPYDIEAVSGDLSLLPKFHYKFKEEYRACAVIRPSNTEELSKIMKTCLEYPVPITIRSAGTSCYSASSPTKGGVIIDMRTMNQIHDVDSENMVVKCDAGISWLRLIEHLLDFGLLPKVYPTSYKSSCIGGFVATAGKAGLGVLKYGSMRDTLISITFVRPDGTIEKITQDSKGDLTLDDICGSFGIYGAIAEVEFSVTSLQTSMELIGFGFTSRKNAINFYSMLKKDNTHKPVFLSFSDKRFEKYAHWTYPAQDFFVFAMYYDNPDVISKDKSFVNDAASKFSGVATEDWYLKEKWRHISDTELNLGRWCQNLIFQEYWISDNKLQDFYDHYGKKIEKHDYNKAIYMIAGCDGRSRIKLYGLTDNDNPREFFGIKSIFHDMMVFTYNIKERLYSAGVVNTLYFLKFHPEEVVQAQKLKNIVDPGDLVNSYRLVKSKMWYIRLQLFFAVAKILF